MKLLIFGVLVGLLWAFCPALVVGLAANSVVVAFGLGFALRPAITRRWVS